MPLAGNSGASHSSGHLIAVPPGGYAAERDSRGAQRPQPVEKVQRAAFHTQALEQQARARRNEGEPKAAEQQRPAPPANAPDRRQTPRAVDTMPRAPFLAQLLAQEAGADTNMAARGAQNGYYRFNPTEAYEATLARDRRIEYISFGAVPFSAAA